MAGSMKAWVKRHGWQLFHTLVGVGLLVQLLLSWRREMEQQEAVRALYADLLTAAGAQAPTNLLVSSPANLIGTALLASLMLGMAVLGWAGKRA